MEPVCTLSPSRDISPMGVYLEGQCFTYEFKTKKSLFVRLISHVPNWEKLLDFDRGAILHWQKEETKLILEGGVWGIGRRLSSKLIFLLNLWRGACELALAFLRFCKSVNYPNLYKTRVS